ncbi:FAD-dependent oxidoreductase [Pseudonocardia acaciae]|uniref:FAD-dependent oxidoreductase n=1 Tax=Pseudonocardia acaciae TaxID=551276 RepID=UPI00048E267F|nr:FAD-dependent oxidoreductase [Pseudonocardia acaciae]
MASNDYDVIVAGGGSAGVAAAVGAARTGARVLLVEAGPCLGGAATLRNVTTYCGLWTQAEPPERAVAGVADEVLDELRRLDGVEGPVRSPSGYVIAVFDPEAAKLALDRVCARAGVSVLLHAMVTGARREDDRVTAVTVADHRGAHELTAAAFVDATGEGDLAFQAGASTRYGNHGTVQAGTLSVRIGGIAPDADVSRDRWARALNAATGTGDDTAADDTARVKERGLVLRLPVSGDAVSYLVDVAYDATDSWDISRAEARGRALARELLAAVRTIPGHERAYIACTGPHLGTRESRHVDARYRLTEADVTGGASFDDSVALGAWPIEYHPGPGRPDVWRPVGGGGAYGIPLRALHSVDTANLFAAGRLADADSLAGGSLRVMGTAFATGHAAGVAAAVLADTARTDPTAVKRHLLAQNARLT